MQYVTVRILILLACVTGATSNIKCIQSADGTGEAAACDKKKDRCSQVNIFNCKTSIIIIYIYIVLAVNSITLFHF